MQSVAAIAIHKEAGTDGYAGYGRTWLQALFSYRGLEWRGPVLLRKRPAMAPICRHPGSAPTAGQGWLAPRSAGSASTIPRGAALDRSQASKVSICTKRVGTSYGGNRNQKCMSLET